MVQLVDTIWANGLWADTVWAEGVWAGGSATATASEPTGGGRGAKRYGRTVKFNGQFYDSVRDRLRLSRDVEAYNKAQDKPVEKQAKAPQKKKPIKAKPVAELAVEIAPQVDYQAIVKALMAREAQNTENLKAIKARVAEIEDDDLEILLLS